MKEFADDNFKFDENGRKLSKWVENTVGKGEIAPYEQFLLFPQCFQKACFPGASKGVIVWEWVNTFARCIDPYTVFPLVNIPAAMQNMGREPSFTTQFAKHNVCPISLCFRDCLPFPERQILDSSTLKDFVENTVGKGEIRLVVQTNKNQDLFGKKNKSCRNESNAPQKPYFQKL